MNSITSPQTAGQQLDPEFVVVNQSMNWLSAQRYCRENFRDLATARNDTENQKISSLVPAGGWAWIGLFRDPHIYWSDGSGYSFSYLSAGSNTIGSMTSICSYTGVKISGTWRLGSCETKLPFVCYSVPPGEWFTVQCCIILDCTPTCLWVKGLFMSLVSQM